MSEEKSIVQSLEATVDDFTSLCRRRPKMAVIVGIVLLCLLVWFVWGKIDDRNLIRDLRSENADLKRDNRMVEAELKGLRETVAPMMALAAKEFPGDEIMEALDKLAEKIEAEPYRKPILSATASVRAIVESQEDMDTHFIDRGGWLAFAKGDTALMVTGSHESRAKQTGKGEVVYRGEFTMDPSDVAAGKPVSCLADADFVQIKFLKIPPQARILGGKAICTINSTVRLEFGIPPQNSNDGLILIPNLDDGLASLREFSGTKANLGE